MPTTNDPFLSTISNESLEVLDRFGPEAPAKLNTYACALEDALLEVLQLKTVLQGQIQQLQSERSQLLEILSDPERSIDYVRRFFSADGISPGGAVISRTEKLEKQLHQH